MAERLFRTLRRSEPGRDGTIEVHYAERFGPGKAVLAVCVPFAGLPLSTGLRHLASLSTSEYAPVVDGDRRTINLFVPCPHVGGELPDLIRAASQNLEWYKKEYGFRNGRIVPGGSRITMLTRLGALSPS